MVTFFYYLTNKPIYPLIYLLFACSATAKSLYSPSSSPSSWSSGSFIIKPVSSTDEEPKSTISLDEINALLEKVCYPFCTLFLC